MAVVGGCEALPDSNMVLPRYERVGAMLNPPHLGEPPAKANPSNLESLLGGGERMPGRRHSCPSGHIQYTHRNLARLLRGQCVSETVFQCFRGGRTLAIGRPLGLPPSEPEHQIDSVTLRSGDRSRTSRQAGPQSRSIGRDLHPS